MAVELIEKHFPNLTEEQKNQFAKLEELYKEWNEKINVISRKDMEEVLKKEIWKYAKRQMTWFKKDKKIKWVRTYNEALRQTGKFIKK